MSGSRKEYEMLFQLNAQLGGSYNSTFSKAQAEIVSMQNQIQSLGKIQSDISAFQKQEAALDSTRQKLELLRKQYENIQQEMSETAKCTSGLQKQASALDAARQKLALLQQQYEKIQQEMSETQKGSSVFKKQASDLDETRQKLELLQKQYQSIQQEISATQKSSSALKNRLLEKQMQIDKTSASVEVYENKVSKMRESLRAAGIDTDNLSQESRRLAAEIDGVKTQQMGVVDSLDLGGESAKLFGAESVAAVESIQQILAAAGIVKLIQEIGSAYVECAKDAMAFESAITGVYKTVDGTDQQLAAIKNEIKEMATEIPATTDEIAAVAEAAGQLGIAADDVMDFTRVMIDLGESTNLTADEAAASLAKFSNITGTAASDYSRLGSVIVDLGNHYATTEADILAMATRLASSGKLAGLTESEIMALATAMSSVGIEAEAGGTAMAQTLSEIEKAVAQGEEDLTKFARIAGMSAEGFVTAWENSPIKAVQSLIAGIGTLDQKGESAVLVLEELGLTGIRQSNMLKSLGLAADTLTGAVDTANTAWDENIALSQEAGKRYATTESQLAMLDNSYSNLKVAIGDVYTPALRELYGVGNEVLGEITQFVEANPGLVKGITATVGVIGLASAGMTAYALAVKASAAANALFTTTIGATALGSIVAITAGVAALTGIIVGLSDATNDEAAAVREMTESSRAEYFQLQDLKSEYEDACDMYGETSDQARYLAWQVDELSVSFENNKQSLDEYLEECDAANESMSKMLETNRDSFDEIGENEGTVLALVGQMQELAAQTGLTVEKQEELKAIIEYLNGISPEFGLNYDDVISGDNDYAAMVENMVKAKAEADRYSDAQKKMIDASNVQYNEGKVLEEQEKLLESAKKRREVAYQEYQEYLRLVTMYDSSGTASIGATFSPEYKEYIAASEACEGYEAQIQETQAVIDEATSDYEYYKDVIVDSVMETENAREASDGLNGAITDMTDQVEALGLAYQNAYTAAYESVTGQYSLWDEAADVTAISSETMSSAMQSQITYWQDYNSNLQSLTERSGDIAGLSEMIASFADGSSNGVNAVAGLASATDEDLAAMVEDWKSLQTEHDQVADSIAKLHVDITTESNAIVQDFETMVKDMNLSAEAATSARYTMQGFINGAKEMLPQVQDTYASVADSALMVINRVLDINSPSREMAWRAEMTWAGYINQTRAMEPELQKAMAEAANLGVDAADMQLTAFTPELLSVISANGTNAVEAQNIHSSAPTEIHVTIPIQGNATPETVEMLNMYGEEFAYRVLSVVEEAGIDSERRSY